MPGVCPTSAQKTRTIPPPTSTRTAPTMITAASERGRLNMAATKDARRSKLRAKAAVSTPRSMAAPIGRLPGQFLALEGALDRSNRRGAAERADEGVLCRLIQRSPARSHRASR